MPRRFVPSCIDVWKTTLISTPHGVALTPGSIARQPLRGRSLNCTVFEVESEKNLARWACRDRSAKEDDMRRIYVYGMCGGLNLG